jgi:hypothetical protein
MERPRIDLVAEFFNSIRLIENRAADLETRMKLLRWAMAGASAYVVYKYTIGQKAKGEDVFKSPESAGEEIPAPAKPKRTRRPKS